MEFLPCPIEPVTKQSIWIAIDDETPVRAFLESTFLNAEFVMSVMPATNTEDDRLALECLVTASAARKVALAFQAKTTPSKLARAAKSAGSKASNRLIAEQLLAVPNLCELLLGFADDLVANPNLLKQ